MYPVYGLAEASLAVTLPKLGAEFRWMRVNRHRLNVGDRVEQNPQNRTMRSSSSAAESPFHRPRCASPTMMREAQFPTTTSVTF
jgi:hypothetical protein